MSYEIRWTDNALKELKRFDRKTRERLYYSVEQFAEMEYGDIRRIQDRRGEMAMRVGDWRIFFTMDNKTVIVLRIRPRGQAYKK